jgi:hypothetical protein
MSADKVTDVKITFLNTVCEMRPYLELNPQSLNDFNICLGNFLLDQSSVIFELTSQIDMKLIRLKRQPHFGASRSEEQLRLGYE